MLVNRTVTFQRVGLISSDVKWVTNPPEVRLNAKETGQRFTLIFQVGQIEEIRRGNDEQSPTATE